MEVSFDNGVVLSKNGKSLHLDPHRKAQNAVATHAHMDHLANGAVTTKRTQQIMKVRRPRSSSIGVDYRSSHRMDGFELQLLDAGHVFGSAMVSVEDTLFTSDFNLDGGLTCGKAEPQPCDTLIVEATYGSPRYVLPDKSSVISEFADWLDESLATGPVAVGAYEFGKAQEVIAIANSIGAEVVATEPIAKLADVYRSNGVHLRYRCVKDLKQSELCEPVVHVVTRKVLANAQEEPMRTLRERGVRTSYVSGWCAFFPGQVPSVDREFPLSDHSDFLGLMEFAESCAPKKVYTVHGYTKELAAAIGRALDIQAVPLE